MAGALALAADIKAFVSVKFWTKENKCRVDKFKGLGSLGGRWRGDEEGREGRGGCGDGQVKVLGN